MEKSFFFNAVVTDGVADRVYTAEDIAERESCLISDGVIGGASLEVTSVSSAGVHVESGAASIRGYTYLNTDFLYLTVRAGDSEYDRIDTVALRLSVSDRAIKAVVIEGTPSSDPVPAELEDTTDVCEMALAEIYVAAGSRPVVSASHITDRRVLAGYTSMKEDLLTVLREYIGEIDPVTSAEVSGLRRLMNIVKTDMGEDTVLCGDGEYRDIPVSTRTVAAEFTFPGTYTFELADAPSEDNMYDIEVQGAGGAGGAYNGTGKRGGGGGGGAYLFVSKVRLDKDRCTVVVGHGGTGVLGSDGEDGGYSAFDGFVAEGGKGGKGGISSAGGAGGVSLYHGGGGSDGDADAEGEIYTYCGSGGYSKYGDGAMSEAGFIAANGNDAQYVGAGGSGASCETGKFDRKGGRGGDGVVVIYRYTADGEVQ